MTAGLAWNESDVPYTDARNDHVAMNAAADPIRYVLARPMVAAPERRLLQQRDIDTAGEIIHKVSGLAADKFANATFLGLSELPTIIGLNIQTVSCKPAAGYGCGPTIWPRSAACTSKGVDGTVIKLSAPAGLKLQYSNTRRIELTASNGGWGTLTWTAINSQPTVPRAAVDKSLSFFRICDWLRCSPAGTKRLG